MVDLSTMSTEELLRLREGSGTPSLSELSTEELLRMKEERKPGIIEDIGNTLPAAVSRIPFRIAGAPGDLFELGMRGGAWFDENVLGNKVKTPQELHAGNPFATSGDIQKRYTETAGVAPFYESQTPVGSVIGETITGAGVGAVTGGIGGGLKTIPPFRGANVPQTVPVPGPIISGATVGGSGGGAAEVARALTEGTPYELPATIGAGIVGGMGGAGLAAGARKVATPRNYPPSRLAMRDRLLAEGFDRPTSGQLSGNEAVMAAERQAFGNRGSNLLRSQRENTTEASLRRVDISGKMGKLADTRTMAKAYEDIGKQYDDFAAHNTMAADQQFGTELGSAWSDYTRLVAPQQQASAIKGYMQAIRHHLVQNGGTIPGDIYKTLRSDMKRDYRNTSNPETQQALVALGDALDNAMERSIAKTNPADAGRFANINRRYRNLLVVSDAVTRGGPLASEGLVTPANLGSAVRHIYGDRNWVTGKGDFADLAHDTQTMLSEMPYTGAASFNKPRFPGNLTAPLQNMVDRARTSGPAQRYLTNQAFPKRPGGVANRIGRSLAPVLPAIANQAIDMEWPNVRPELLAVIQALMQPFQAPTALDAGDISQPGTGGGRVPIQ